MPASIAHLQPSTFCNLDDNISMIQSAFTPTPPPPSLLIPKEPHIASYSQHSPNALFQDPFLFYIVMVYLKWAK